MTASIVRVLVLAAFAGLLPVQAQPQAAATRGELLYSTHCLECHNAQIHWRKRKQARDWNSLKIEVRRWEKAARLGWDESEIESVAHYLNRTVYHFPSPAEHVGLK